ncbi:MAG: gluconokinase [Mesorhizobium sp.]|uniref:gluconokinase n=1 Tax=Mesorhizobium sp. TaxID=1871066 RepID=UPI001205AD1C|nr:gluconokinase [Mesorhizobium sp.]TIM91521.1 MAG: gluconokinase [Mesorhizobium sp.]
MGVAGCGKTVMGEALAEALGAVFIEGDRLHPPKNVARMARGEPLTDALREGWLDASVGEGHKPVAACSALKRSYRNRLLSFCPGIVFLYLKIDRETARRRVSGRKGHFMPASLVDSQFATLEEPEPDEPAVTADGARSVAAILKQALSSSPSS